MIDILKKSHIITEKHYFDLAGHIFSQRWSLIRHGSSERISRDAEKKLKKTSAYSEGIKMLQHSGESVWFWKESLA